MFAGLWLHLGTLGELDASDFGTLEKLGLGKVAAWALQQGVGSVLLAEQRSGEEPGRTPGPGQAPTKGVGGEAEPVGSAEEFGPRSTVGEELEPSVQTKLARRAWWRSPLPG